MPYKNFEEIDIKNPTIAINEIKETDTLISSAWVVPLLERHLADDGWKAACDAARALPNSNLWNIKRNTKTFADALRNIQITPGNQNDAIRIVCACIGWNMRNRKLDVEKPFPMGARASVSDQIQAAA